MKYLTIKEQLLNEINMSPNSLRRAAAGIGARAGMEFEMIVPGAAEADADYDMEPDIDSDESVGSIQEAYDFFYDSDYNSRRDVDRLRDRMQSDYQDWVSDQFGSRWDSDQDTFIYNYLKENASNDEIAEILGREDDEDTKDNYGRKEVAEAVDKVMEEGSGNDWYDQAYESAYEDYTNEDHESDWLDDQGISTMWDVQSNYDISWPHYYNPSQGGDVNVEDTADSFSRAIGRAVEASGNYHSRSVERPSATKLHYVVEPDGSLEADDDNDGGLEFVSPALPIDELLDDLKKVKAWADKTGCYTNDSTGLHINISVPNWTGDLAKLDFVKLAILMGDEYILEQFGRTGNTYAKSAMKIVRDHIAQRPDDIKLLLDKMKEHLNTAAAKLIHSGSTSKYTSVNTKDGYIEFRSPGGDWLNSNFDKIESTLLRLVVAMDAAVDETKYKEEYAKKLYKLLAPGANGTDTMSYFARFAAGELPQSALKSFVRQAQLERKVKANPTGGSAGNTTDSPFIWKVIGSADSPYQSQGIEVVATSELEAMKKARQQWNLNTSGATEEQFFRTNGWRATAVRPADSETPVPGSTQDLQQRRAQGGFTGSWKIVDDNGRELYRFSGVGNQQADANRVAAQWIQSNPGVPYSGGLSVLPVMG